MAQGRGRRTFGKEFKAEAVQLSQQPGMSVAKAATDLGVSANTLYRWRAERQEDGDEAFRGHGRLRSDQAELARLQRENAELRMEREILKKAAAYFAKHQH
jgi:transposase